MTENQKEEARKHVGRLKAFYHGLIMYLIVNIGLVILNLLTDPQNLWFYWVTLFWGLGLLMQAATIWGPISSLSKEWEEKKITEYLDKNKKQ